MERVLVQGKFHVPPYATDYELLFRSLNQAVRYGEMTLSESLSTTKLLLAKDKTTLQAIGLGLTPADCEFSEDLADGTEGSKEMWDNIENKNLDADQTPTSPVVDTVDRLH